MNASVLVNSNDQTVEVTREEGKVFLVLGWLGSESTRAISLNPNQIRWLIEQLEAQLKEKT